MKDVSHFINIFLTIFIQILNLNDFFFVDFDGDIQMMSPNLIIFFMLVLGSPFNDRKSSRDKASVSNPKANRLSSTHRKPHFSSVCAKLTRNSHLAILRWGTLILGGSTLWQRWLSFAYSCCFHVCAHAFYKCTLRTLIEFWYNFQALSINSYKSCYMIDIGNIHTKLHSFIKCIT